MIKELTFRSMSEQNTNNVLLLMDSKDDYIYHEQIGTKVISSVEQ